jgi:hypothetical protein
MHGYGVFTWPNGQVFKGLYANEKKSGKGELKLADGTVIKGTWVNSKLEGTSEVLKNGEIHKVEWRNGVEL